MELEIKETPDTTMVFQAGSTNIMVTPRIDEDYWIFRVKLTEKQAIVGFQKFSTVGIGFAVEDDWNTNLPYRCTAKMIFDHIEKNKGDDSIADAQCIEAIEMVQAAAHRFLKTDPNAEPLR